MKLLEDLVGRCSDVVSLAQGGQKKVLAAIHPEFGPVVIKYGNYRYATSLERITREVTLLRELESSYYPKHCEFLIEPVRREILVVEERLDAVELTHVKDRFASDTQILDLLRNLICALHEIWRRNVVHRDIKPANILVTATDEPRIIDLGIARFLDDTSLTASLAACGPATPIYAAPEQLINRKTMINVRTDFFLLGILVLELMHGFHPFDPQHVGNQNSLIDNIMHGVYVPPAGGERSARCRGSLCFARQPAKFLSTALPF
jgi:eukaryotic-like serine/threonine-protein kinase